MYSYPKPVMRKSKLSTTICAISLLSACMTLAPGADKVALTKTASDVSGCSAVGNIKASIGPQGEVDFADASTEVRNQVIGLGGNTAFVSSGTLGVPVEGIAYRCP